jgi:tRNA dimethylallyltransferase
MRALAIAGPTAAGKSAAALSIARELPCEIVSVDSALVYRGMDIGTAKPGAAERAAVAHPLIDVLDPGEAYSAARFVADARRLIAEIQARGRLPLLVGGTMLYFKALNEGLDELPAADARLRAEIDAEAARAGWPALHARLARSDPATAERLAPNDAQRIQRALEVLRLTGRPLSHWHSTKAAAAPLPMLTLEPRERSWLHARIAARLHAMIEQGFLDEVRRLHARGDLHPGLPSMRSVGYRQAFAALEEGTPEALATWPLQAIAATRQLAKRQLTWLRAMPWREAIEADAPEAIERVVTAAKRIAAT